MPRRDTRSIILRTALKLFYVEGSHAVGVDRIIAEAQVAKASFYKHFPSKAALLVATLQTRDADVRAWLCHAATAHAEQHEVSPAIALFDIVERWAGSDGFHGCGFLRAVFDAPDDAYARAIAARHKQQLEDWIDTNLPATPASKGLAAALMILLDGGIAQAFVHQDPGRVAIARGVAARLLVATP